MTDVQLQPIDRFHRELKSLAAAGIPVELGIAGGSQQLSAALDDIRIALSVRVSLGQSLEQAIQQDERLPERYRAAAQAWLRFDAPAMVLDAVTEADAHDPRWDRGIALSLLQTLVILAMVTIGLSVASLWLSPKVDAIYAQLNQTPTTAAQFLSAARYGLPIWATAATSLFLITIWLWYRSNGNWSARWAAYLPVARRRQLLIHRARFAAYLAGWLQYDLPLDEGIRLATALSGEVPSNQGATPDIASKHEATGEQADDDLQEVHLPPLIQWALYDVAANEPLWIRLRTVAEVYRASADRQLTLWTRFIPTLVAAGLCGIAVLLYGLSVFLPVIGLLQDVAAPGNH